MIKDHLCYCKHPQQHHKDTGSDSAKGWGMGGCTICRCQNYICKNCTENPPEPRKLPPNKARIKNIEKATFDPELSVSEVEYYRDNSTPPATEERKK
jgi:hypothetical protein